MKNKLLNLFLLIFFVFLMCQYNFKILKNIFQFLKTRPFLGGCGMEGRRMGIGAVVGAERVAEGGRIKSVRLTNEDRFKFKYF